MCVVVVCCVRLCVGVFPMCGVDNGRNVLRGGVVMRCVCVVLCCVFVCCDVW